jgi:mycofactocin precursor peptide peptidase
VHALSDCAWTDLTGPGRRLVAVPVGSCEQHGPHLPLTTDTVVATALVAGLVAARADVVAAPPLAYGASGEHAGFPGTLSIGTDALTAVVVELARSAAAFAGIVFVNAHGGNADALARAGAVLAAEARPVLLWSPTVPDGDAHAGRTETSLLLALDPDRVALDRAAAGERRPLPELLPVLRARGVAAVSANGVLGDPTGAGAAEGRHLLDALVGDLVAAVADRFGPPVTTADNTVLDLPCGLAHQQ